MTKTNGEQAAAGPVRMCVICRRRFPKKELHRHVTGPQGGLDGDSEQILPGRGYYVCSDTACRQKFAKYRPRTGKNRGKAEKKG